MSHRTNQQIYEDLLLAALRLELAQREHDAAKAELARARINDLRTSVFTAAMAEARRTGDVLARLDSEHRAMSRKVILELEERAKDVGGLMPGPGYFITADGAPIQTQPDMVPIGVAVSATEMRLGPEVSLEQRTVREMGGCGALSGSGREVCIQPAYQPHLHAWERTVAIDAEDPPRTLGRDDRQATVFAWARAAFGDVQATSLPQRGLRLLEEASEAFQACGGSRDLAHLTVDHVFDRPPGELNQELGGVGVTTIALAAAAHLSADEEEAREVARILSKPIEHYTARNAAKNAAGLLAPDAKRDVSED